MSSTENLRQAFQNNPDIDWDLDWTDPEQVAELLASDGEGGEGVTYHQHGTETMIWFSRTWGQWVAGDDRTGDWTVYPDRAAAKAAYIALIETRQAEGVTWEPDWCPIFDRIEATWK